MLDISKEKNDLKLAVLIDADNISARFVKGMMQEIALYGTPTIKRIYGDWTRPNMLTWKMTLLDYAIAPVQQFGYTYGKNATDSAMIIDAMDILYENRVDGFCLVSSDSDFTRLATRLREAGKMVFGIGEQKTPNAFIAACDKFIYLEILTVDETLEGFTVESEAVTGSPAKSLSRPPHEDDIIAGHHILSVGPDVINLIKSCITDLADEQGWAFLGDVGNLLLKVRPAFDSRSYGYPKLTPLIRSIDSFEINERPTGQNNVKHIFIRIR